MIDTKKAKGRGRPRGFDADRAVEIAQALFHRHGYDGVSMTDLTAALGINPPSFYAAFGSKAALFAQVLARYESASGLPIGTLLRDDRPVAEGLAALLVAAAQIYARDPARPGCMVMEASRDTSDPTIGAIARAMRGASRDYIHAFIARRHPDAADLVSDYMMTSMAGLSSAAREHLDGPRLIQVAQLAGAGLPRFLES